MKNKKFTFLMLLPSILIFILLGLYPTIEALLNSFTDYSLTSSDVGKNFIGLNNYIQMLTDQRFWMALGRTLLFVAISVFISFVIGFGIALILNKITFGKGFFRIIFLIPMVIAPAVTALNFRFMYNLNLGIFNHILNLVGFGGIDFLGNPNIVLGSAIMVDVWQWTPLVILVLLSGLESLPSEPYEAANIDGANSFQVFKFLTIPLLKKFITIVLAIRIMDSFRVYEVIQLMTVGGPGTASETLNIYLSKVGFNWFDIGYAAAIGIFTLYFTMFLAKILINKTGAFKSEKEA